ncbi:MAG: hypothetical protein OHK0012_07460 [Synechococcales cyanobacterium]
MLSFGKVVEVDPQTCRVRVELADLDGMQSYWLAVVQGHSLRDKVYSLPDVDEFVAFLLDAQAEEGVVLGAIYSDPDPTPSQDGEVRMIRFEDGTVVQYDRAASRLMIDCVGDVVIRSATQIQIQAPRVDLN